MSYLLSLALLYLASMVRAQMDPGCGTTSAAMLPATVTSCTLFYTASMPPQINSTSTVYATIMTTQFNVVDCNFCHISNVAENPLPTVSSQLLPFELTY